MFSFLFNGHIRTHYIKEMVKKKLQKHSFRLIAKLLQMWKKYPLSSVQSHCTHNLLYDAIGFYHFISLRQYMVDG